MRALVCEAYGPIDTLVVKDIPSPVPGPRQVLIEVRAAAVNFPDALMVQGLYQVKPPLPFTPGAEIAGIVKAAGITATIHDLRRSFSTLAQRAGVDRMTVKDLGGWSSVAVVEKHYTGEIKPVLERAMELIARAQGVA